MNTTNETVTILTKALKDTRDALQSLRETEEKIISARAALQPRTDTLTAQLIQLREEKALADFRAGAMDAKQSNVVYPSTPHYTVEDIRQVAVIGGISPFAVARVVDGRGKYIGAVTRFSFVEKNQGSGLAYPSLVCTPEPLGSEAFVRTYISIILKDMGTLRAGTACDDTVLYSMRVNMVVEDHYLNPHHPITSILVKDGSLTFVIDTSRES